MYLRQNYNFGPLKIQMYLKRYHDVEIGQAAVYKILKRMGLDRLPTSQRYQRRDKRYQKQLPGNRVEIDVKFIEPIAAGKADQPQAAGSAPVDRQATQAAPPRHLLPVHQDRRLHSTASATRLPAL